MTVAAPGFTDEPAAAGAVGNGDVNGDGVINITDAIYLLNWEFRQGPEPVAIPRLTLAPTEDDLRPERHHDASFSAALFQRECDFATAGRLPFFILEPGYRIWLAGDEEGTAVRVEITVLDELELVDGVMTRVVEEREWAGGELSELSRHFVAICEQSGDLYSFGEDVQTFGSDDPDGWEEDDEDDSDEGVWRAGVDGARAGILLPGNPMVGARYLNESAPGVAMDRTEIVEIADQVTLAGAIFARVLIVYETSGLELEEGSVKYFAEGVGMIKDGALEVVDYGFIPNIGEAEGLQSLSITLSVNDTEGDARVRLTAEAPEGLHRVFVLSPKGEKVLDVRWARAGPSGEAQPLATRRLAVESDRVPLEAMADSFPEGAYRVEGVTLGGRGFVGEAVLAHALLPAPWFSVTQPDAARPAAIVSWSSVEGAASYLIEIESKDLGTDMTATVSDGETCFEVPACILLPGAEYDVSVGAVGPHGNVTLSERRLATAEP